MGTRRVIAQIWRIAAVAALGCSGGQETATGASTTSVSSTSVSAASGCGTTVDASGGETTGASGCSSAETASGGAADDPDEGCGGCGDGEICVAWGVDPIACHDFIIPDLEVSCEPLPESCACAEEWFCGEYDCLFELCGTIDCIAGPDFVCGEYGPVEVVCEYAGPRYDLEMGLVGDYCSISEQDCPSGFKCAQWYAYSGWGDAWVASCVPLSPDAAGPGGPCETLEYKQGVVGDTCDASSICVDGACAPICAGGGTEPVECAPGEVCAPYLYSEISVCTETCEPLVQDCPNGQLCLPQGDGWLCVDDASGDGGRLVTRAST